MSIGGTGGIGRSGGDNVFEEIIVGGIPVHKSLGHQLTTGVINGGGRGSVNTDTTKFDISAGQGIYMILDDADNPIYELISWDIIEAITPDFSAQSFSYIYIDVSDGTVGQQSTDFTCADRRDKIVLMVVVAQDLVNVDSFIDVSRSVSTSYLASDMIKFIGVMNRQNFITNNGANLQLDKSEGRTFGENINRDDVKDSNNQPDAAAPAFTFNQIFQKANGDIDFDPAHTAINPNEYDNESGTPAAVGSGNKWTNKHVYFFPDNALISIQLGKVIFTTFAAAKADALLTAPDSFNGLLPLSRIRAVVTCKQGVTDLDAAILAGDAFISRTGLFGFGA